MKKGLTQFVSNLLLLMYRITYFNTICVHPLKSVYSLLKMRTVKKD